VSAIQQVQERLGYVFHDEALLRLALTHPSVTQEPGGEKTHNQRLEFLGDAVLQLVLTHEMYEKFPAAAEGQLTKARAGLVNRHSLAARGRHLGIGEGLILSRGEELSGGRERPSALADAFESVVGAIYLDGGFACVSEFIRRQFSEALVKMDEPPVIANPKGELQELLQARTGVAPDYRFLSATGPDHDRTFECIVLHLGVELGRGNGRSKKAAESQAALVALQRMQSENADPVCAQQAAPQTPGAAANAPAI
jgi:ribonuclease-3